MDIEKLIGEYHRNREGVKILEFSEYTHAVWRERICEILNDAERSDHEKIEIIRKTLGNKSRSE